jgi:hypothetical protein
VRLAKDREAKRISDGEAIGNGANGAQASRSPAGEGPAFQMAAQRVASASARSAGAEVHKPHPSRRSATSGSQATGARVHLNPRPSSSSQKRPARKRHSAWRPRTSSASTTARTAAASVARVAALEASVAKATGKGPAPASMAAARRRSALAHRQR